MGTHMEIQRSSQSKVYLFNAGKKRSSAEAIVEVGKDVLPDQVGGLLCGEVVLEWPDMRAGQA